MTAPHVAVLDRLKTAIEWYDSGGAARQDEYMALIKAAYISISDGDARLSAVTAKVREIHEVMKRGKSTEDHGLNRNLACILDHALRKYDPDPI